MDHADAVDATRALVAAADEAALRAWWVDSLTSRDLDVRGLWPALNCRDGVKSCAGRWRSAVHAGHRPRTSRSRDVRLSTRQARSAASSAAATRARVASAASVVHADDPRDRRRAT